MITPGKFTLSINRGVYQALCNYLGEDELHRTLKSQIVRGVCWRVEEEIRAPVNAEHVEVFVSFYLTTHMSLLCEIPILELFDKRLTESAAFWAGSYLTALIVRWLKSIGSWNEDLWTVIHTLVY